MGPGIHGEYGQWDKESDAWEFAVMLNEAYARGAASKLSENLGVPVAEPPVGLSAVSPAKAPEDAASIPHAGEVQKFRPSPDPEFIEFTKALLASGHRLVEDDEGFVDEGAYHEESCHGPLCQVCGMRFCANCFVSGEGIGQCSTAGSRGGDPAGVKKHRTVPMPRIVIGDDEPGKPSGAS